MSPRAARRVQDHTAPERVAFGGGVVLDVVAERASARPLCYVRPRTMSGVWGGWVLFTATQPKRSEVLFPHFSIFVGEDDDVAVHG